MYYVIPEGKYKKEYQTFYTAIRDRDVKRVESLLQNPIIDPSMYNNYAIKLATISEQSTEDSLQIVRSLLHDRRVDPGVQFNYIFRTTVDRGDIDLVELLIQCDRVNPGDYEDYAIRNACRDGREEIVDFLLLHPKVDPTSKDCQALLFAVENGHYNIVKLLLEDGRCDPSFANNRLVRLLSMITKHLDILELLLCDKRVDKECIHPSAFKRLIGMNMERRRYRRVGEYLLLSTREKSLETTRSLNRTPIAIDRSYIGDPGDWSQRAIAVWASVKRLESAIEELPIEVKNKSIWPAVSYALRTYNRRVKDTLEEYMIGDIVWTMMNEILGMRVE